MSAWPLVPLGEIFEIARGGSPRPIDAYITDADDGINWISIADASDSSKYIERTKRRIRPEGAIRSRAVVPGDLLLTNSMSFGRPYIMRTTGCIHDGWLVLAKKREGIDQDFFYRLLGSETVYAAFARLAAGATVKNLNIDLVRGVSLPVPPLPEQRRIAAILDQADALRAKRRETLAQLDSLTQSIFIEMFGNYRTGGIPWPIRPVEDIAVDMTIGLVRSAAEFGPDFDVPYVRMNAIGQHGEFLPNLVMRTVVNESEFERYELRPGDLLFNTRNSRELVGKTALFRESGRYVFNNNLMRIRFRDGVHAEYVAAAFQTPYIQQELATRKAGTTSVFAIYARELKTVPVPVPPFSLQQLFATRIQAVDSLKTTHRAAMAELDALFASLQHRAFSGGL